ncbi:YidC/Oxa1 family membrane protein insertase [Roseiflexus castenholzii]|uniref:60 kDa inner membrane insertion protein n=1 Tax=Roseiflexus castenholzii (strain DSM 13941 / HLO8) TaxID=383372 RepID=A7NJ56_ROSCS|nr:YidC/Oxa1 family membrane protein insertase [Roseiflexus castenholzii]ABU57522.1 60 kDa inner membrane insertion protein [Roseiflexus castenholzii DSM 13941]
MPVWLAFVEFLQQVLLTFYAWTGSAGLAIILFTIVARLLILPLTIKSLQSSRKMQELQPHMKELQRKYGKDPQKLQEETMRLYREYKVNPVGGCLPMLLQLPIFLGVYQAVINLTRVSPAEHAGSAMLRVLNEQGIAFSTATTATLGQPQLAGSFLWLPDLGKTDPYYILPILSVIFQLIVQLMATPRIQDPQQKAMMQSMLILPIVFGYIGFIFPSGAVLYWVVGSILSIIQQYVISGWGSLANYLKFLPTDGGLLPPITPPAQSAASAVGGGSPAASEESSRKVDFWDVLRPLTEARSEPAEPQSLSSGSAAPVESAAPTEAARAEARRVSSQMNPRRRRARR